MKKFDYEVIFDAKDYKRFEDFYEDISRKLEAVENGYYDHPETFGYSTDWLWEYLQDMHYCDFKIKVILKNFDMKKIYKEKTFDDLKIKRVLRCFDKLAERYPENVVEFDIDEENRVVLNKILDDESY